MTAEEALRDVRGFASANRISLTSHARKRMRQRGARFSDVQHALANATDCRTNRDGWRIAGPDATGDELVLIVALENGVVVVTVF